MKRTKTLKALSILSLALFLILPTTNAEPISRQKPRPNLSAYLPSVISRNHRTPMTPKRPNPSRIINNNIPNRLRRNLAAELAECARSENNTANDGNSAQ